MTAHRSVLLVVHTGRDEATETARRVEKYWATIKLRFACSRPKQSTEGRCIWLPTTCGPWASRSRWLTRTSTQPTAANWCWFWAAMAPFAGSRAGPQRQHSGVGRQSGPHRLLAEAEAEAIDAVLEHVVAQDYRVEDRLTLDVVVRQGGRIVNRGWALNEVSLEKGPRLGVLGVVVEIDGRPVSAFGCDGVLVSTPTGSTAYAFSAGGPVLWPDLEAILVVPNNAHALFGRPMVTSPEATIAIEIEADGHDALVFCDGRREMLIPAGSRLEVTRCVTSVKWARLDSAPFTDRLVRKFRLPVTGWRGK